MIAAVRVEAQKLGGSLVGTVSTLAIVLGVLALLTGITAGVAGGNSEVIAQAGAAAKLDWTGLLSGATQIVAVAAILGAGVVLAWLFAREFADGTIGGLFALPVSRGRIALAKLVAFAGWGCVVAVALPFAVVLLGLVLGYGSPRTAAWAGLVRLAGLVLLSCAVAVPVAWVATVTRSLLAGVAATIALVVGAQVGAMAGNRGWVPMAAPALWAMTDGVGVSPAQLALTLIVAAMFVSLVLWTWSRLELDR